MPDSFMPMPMPMPAEHRSTPKPHRETEAGSFTQRFWPWFSIGVLLFCWIAEATMCAERGF